MPSWDQGLLLAVRSEPQPRPGVVDSICLVVIEQVAGEGAAIQAKRLSALLHLFKNAMVEADASSGGGR